MTATVGFRAAAWEAGLTIECWCWCSLQWISDRKITACLGRSSFLSSESLWILSLPSAPEVLTSRHGQCHLGSLLLQLFKLPCQSFSSIILETALPGSRCHSAITMSPASNSSTSTSSTSSCSSTSNVAMIPMIGTMVSGQSWCSAVPSFAQLCQHEGWWHDDADTCNRSVSAEFTFLQPCSCQITSRITWTLKKHYMSAKTHASCPTVMDKPMLSRIFDI